MNSIVVNIVIIFSLEYYQRIDCQSSSDNSFFSSGPLVRPARLYENELLFDRPCCQNTISVPCMLRANQSTSKNNMLYSTYWYLVLYLHVRNWYFNTCTLSKDSPDTPQRSELSTESSSSYVVPKPTTGHSRGHRSTLFANFFTNPTITYYR